MFTKITRSKTVRVVTIAFIVITGFLGLYTWMHYSPSAAIYTMGDSTKQLELPYRLRTMDEHDKARTKNGGNPYILQIVPADQGAIYYYGASHTTDPNHPQIKDIADRWEAFEPTVALCEGRTRGYFYGDLIEPFAGLPEPALVHKLAKQDGIPVYSLEPSYEEEIEQLRKQFDAKQIGLYFFLRVYISEAFGTPNEALAIDLLRKRTDVKGLKNSLPDLRAIDELWKQEYPEESDWRTRKRIPQSGVLVDVESNSRRIRGEHMIRILVDLAQKGERVFAVVGSGHVIRQEWNLRYLFKMEPAWDQPLLQQAQIQEIPNGIFDRMLPKLILVDNNTK